MRNESGGRELQSRRRLRDSSPLSYVDLLILTLTQHEKELHLIIDKLEKISEKLEEISLLLAKDENRG